MPTECRLHPMTELPSTDQIERLRKLATSLVSDVFGRWAGAPGLVPIAGLPKGTVMVGPAMTVRTREGDNLVVHKALELVRAGEILVVDAGGSTDRAILGGLIGQYAASRGVAGIVVDGAVRDKSELDEGAPPVFARGLTHRGPYKDGPGEIRCDVAIAGLSVRDGDLIIGDEDGIAVIPRERAEEIIALAESKRSMEAAERAAIASGEWDREWIDQALTVVEIP
jgi:RraA family protein